MSSSIEARALRARWLRQTVPGREPLVRATPPSDGRWQRGERVGAIYLADCEQTIWAEWYRALAEAAIPPRMWLPASLWQIDVALEGIADLTEEELQVAGLPPLTPARASWAPYQRLGERLFAEGFAGLIAPSAARPAGRVLCIFCPDAEAPGVRVAAEPVLVAEVPVPPRGMQS